MNKKLIKDLILSIISYSSEIGGYTTTIRLVKYLYLIDLEHYRRYQSTLTKLNWIFHLYGPYSFELQQIGKNIGYDLETEEFDNNSGKAGVLYKVRDSFDFPSELSHSVQTIISGLLNIWALEDTSMLLEYTYNSEPMSHAQRGEALDFSVVPSGSFYYEFYIPEKKKAAARIKENLKSLFLDQENKTVATKTKINQAFEEEFTRILSEEDIKGFNGISPTINDDDEFKGSLP